MDALGDMNRALDYIEEHLTQEIDLNCLATLAQCSTYHFQRFFTYICGVSLSEYIRRRRLSSAGFELQLSDIKVIDLAVKYGYESSASFSRAFQALHGVTPTEARKGHPLKSYPKMVFRLSVTGDVPLQYRIVTKPSFRMLVQMETIEKKNDENLRRIPELWRSRKRERERLASLSKEPAGYFYGLTMNYRDDRFDYGIGVITDQPVREKPVAEELTTGGLSQLMIPTANWAIFQCTGALPKAQYDLWRRIFTEWLPFSGYELAPIPEMERYPQDDIKSSAYESEIWLPLRDKERAVHERIVFR